ncbi:hypothetical protein Q8A73_013360 [Channa argus]|nr:hypothetical protein Q8A73_013360 [Channa argus]
MNWTSAQSFCRKNYKDLVTVTNAQVNQKIQALVQSDYVWIGLFRQPSFYWSDQSIFSFNSFDNTQNPVGSLNVICGVANLQNSGKWKFLPCDTKRPYVCYSIRKQVVNLRMKLQDSSVDLNDPAVKADLLKQFEVRLEENGLSGVTLNWREQPDGKVFHKEKEANHAKRKTVTAIDVVYARKRQGRTLFFGVIVGADRQSRGLLRRAELLLIPLSRVAKVALIQTKGTGASGSFKINKKAKTRSKTPAKKPAAKKPTAAVKPKAASAKKPTAAKKFP